MSTAIARTLSLALILCAVGCHGSITDHRIEVHLLILDTPTQSNIYYPFAIDYVNNLTPLFPNFRLKAWRLLTDRLDTGSAAKRFIDGYFARPQKALVIGPFLSQQAQSVADVAKYYHVTEIGSTGTSPALSDKKAYPYYFRMCGIDSQYTGLIVNLLLKYNWRRVGLLAADSTGFYPVALELENGMLAYNITQYQKVIFSQEASDEIKILADQDIRIFIIVRLVFYEFMDKRLECQIAKYKLFGPKYMWIQLGFTQSTIPFVGGCNREAATAALEGALEFDSAISDISYPRPLSMLGLTAEQMLDQLIGGDPFKARLAEASTIYGLDLKFDSILAAALAINRTLQLADYDPDEVTKGDTDFKRTLFESVKALDFVGLSGRVAFNSKNDRTSTFLVYQIRSGSPPVDSPQLELHLTRLSFAAAVAVSAVALVGAALSVLSIAASCRLRSKPAIRQSGPLANDCIAVGCLLAYAACVFMAVNAHLGASPSLCWTQSVLMASGYSIAMGAMLVKIWLAHRSNTDRRLRALPLNNWHLLAAIVILTTIDAVTFAAWAATDPLQSVIVNLGDTELPKLGKIIRHQVATCQSASHNIWIGVLIGVKGILLLFGVFFAWETRNLQLAAINDSRQIGMCIYNTMMMGLLGLVLSFTLPVSEIGMSTCLLACCVMICLLVILALVFGHKLLILTGHLTETEDSRGFADSASSTAGLPSQRSCAASQQGAEETIRCKTGSA